ncbi:hypothetical protein BOTU111922_20480 [Bordetella tumulicola]
MMRRYSENDAFILMCRFAKFDVLQTGLYTGRARFSSDAVVIPVAVMVPSSCLSLIIWRSRELSLLEGEGHTHGNRYR